MSQCSSHCYQWKPRVWGSHLGGVTVEIWGIPAGGDLRPLPTSTRQFCFHLFYILASVDDFVWKNYSTENEHYWLSVKFTGLGV